MSKQMCVYWVHLPDSNIKTDGYVGVSKDVKARWRKHKNANSGSLHFKNAINKYGADLIWDIIFTGTEEGCLQLEEYFRPSTDIGWNMKEGGKYAKLSQVSIDKMARGLTGKKHTTEVIERRRQAVLTCDSPQVRLINVYDRYTNKCLASGIRTSEWIRNNPIYSHMHLQATARANRTKPSTEKNRLYHKGIYAVYCDTMKKESKDADNS